MNDLLNQKILGLELSKFLALVIFAWFAYSVYVSVDKWNKTVCDYMAKKELKISTSQTT